MNKPIMSMVSVAVLGVLIGACTPDDAADDPQISSTYDPEAATTDEGTRIARAEPETDETTTPMSRYDTDPQQDAGISGSEVESDPTFAELDSDADGSVSPKEAAAEPYVQDNFQAADTNQDGLLSSTEFNQLTEETEDSE